MIVRSGVPVGAAVDHAVTAMVDQTLGPFTYYVPPDQVGTFRSNGVVSGIGVLLDARDAAGSKCAVLGGACGLEVVFVLEENPGAEAGLAAGDTIVAVDGRTVEGMGFATTASLIAGDETGTVELTVDREGDSLTFSIVRAELTVPTVEVRLPQPSVGYLRIPDFEDDIPSLVVEGLESLAEISPSTIVVDLRDNPGGFVDSAVDVTSEFVDGGVVLETFGPDEEFQYTATSGGLATNERLIVLVNQGSASAAEVVAGALRDRRSATIVGTPTFGKDAVQIPFELRNGGELYVAVARWATPNGTTVGIGGLIPDRELELTADMTTEDVVEAALDAVS
jgi:carboxyl-terminal processing protease